MLLLCVILYYMFTRPRLQIFVRNTSKVSTILFVTAAHANAIGLLNPPYELYTA